jgi:hypothetical protein
VQKTAKYLRIKPVLKPCALALGQLILAQVPGTEDFFQKIRQGKKQQAQKA